MTDEDMVIHHNSQRSISQGQKPSTQSLKHPPAPTCWLASLWA